MPQGVIRSLDDYIAADKYDLKQFFDTFGCVRPDVLDDPFFAEPNFQPLKEMLLRALPNYAPANYRGTEYQDAFGQTHSLMYLGKVPFDQGLKDLSDALQRVLDKPTT